LLELKGTGQAWTIVFSPDGQRIVIGFASGEVKVWDTLHYNQLFVLHDHSQAQKDERVGIESLSVSSDGALVAVGTANGLIYLYSLSSGQLFDMLKGHNRSISYLCFSPNNQLLASYDSAGFIEIWQLNQAKCSVLKIIYHFLHPIDALCWRDNDHIVLASKGGSDGIPYFYKLTLEST
jgi:WD40 repeat protein